MTCCAHFHLECAGCWADDWRCGRLLCQLAAHPRRWPGQACPDNRPVAYSHRGASWPSSSTCSGGLFYYRTGCSSCAIICVVTSLLPHPAGHWRPNSYNIQNIYIAPTAPSSQGIVYMTHGLLCHRLGQLSMTDHPCSHTLLPQLLDTWLPYSTSTESPLIEKGIVYMTVPGVGPAVDIFLYDWRYSPSCAFLTGIYNPCHTQPGRIRALSPRHLALARLCCRSAG